MEPRGLGAQLVTGTEAILAETRAKATRQRKLRRNRTPVTADVPEVAISDLVNPDAWDEPTSATTWGWAMDDGESTGEASEVVDAVIVDGDEIDRHDESAEPKPDRVWPSTADSEPAEAAWEPEEVPIEAEVLTVTDVSHPTSRPIPVSEEFLAESLRSRLADLAGRIVLVEAERDTAVEALTELQAETRRVTAQVNQARDAMEAERTRNSDRDAEAERTRHLVADLEQRLEQAANAREMAESEGRALATRVDELQVAGERAAAEAEGLRAALLRTQSEVADIEDLRNQLAVAIATIAEQRQDLEFAAASNAELTLEVNVLKADALGVDEADPAEVAALKAELGTAREAHRSAAADWHTQQEISEHKHSMLKAAFDDQAQALQRFTNQAADLRKENLALVEQIETLTAECEATQRALGETKQEVHEANERATAATRNVEHLTAQLADRTLEAQTIAGEVDELKATLAARDQTLSDVRGEVATLTGQQEITRAELAALQALEAEVATLRFKVTSFDAQARELAEANREIGELRAAASRAQQEGAAAVARLRGQLTTQIAALQDELRQERNTTNGTTSPSAASVSAIHVSPALTSEDQSADATVVDLARYAENSPKERAANAAS